VTSLFRVAAAKLGEVENMHPGERRMKEKFRLYICIPRQFLSKGKTSLVCAYPLFAIAEKRVRYRERKDFLSFLSLSFHIIENFSYIFTSSKGSRAHTVPERKI